MFSIISVMLCLSPPLHVCLFEILVWEKSYDNNNNNNTIIHYCIFDTFDSGSKEGSLKGGLSRGSYNWLGQLSLTRDRCQSPV